VEVVGFPELGGPSPLLREAVARKLGHAALPAPHKLTPQNLLGSEHDSTLVQVEALLVNVANDGMGIELQAGVRKFVARLAGNANFLRSIPIGSRLALTGVYVGQGGGQMVGQGIQSFELLLNSRADVMVLAHPPWWTLGRMLAIVGVLIGVLAVALFWITLLHRQVEQRTTLLEQEIQEREHAEHHQAMEEERSRIARDLHDDLGSSLTEISMLAETGRDQLQPAEDPRKRFDKILNRAQALVRTLDEIVWAVDPRKDTLSALVRYLAGFAEEYGLAAGLACRVDMPASIPEISLAARVRHHLFLGVKEALNNAVRHAHATEVVFQINLADNNLKITLIDNGCGFDPAAAREGNGLANLSQRLAGLHGRCEINSRRGAGASVLLALPLSAAQ
jgi:signal transduction histidine kinase